MTLRFAKALRFSGKPRFSIPLVIMSLAPASWGQEADLGATVTTADVQTEGRVERGPFELGLFGGMMSLSENHNLRDPDRPVVALEDVAPELGARASYFPIEYLGIGAEAALIPTATVDGAGVIMGALRAHAMVQYPMTHLTPFVLLGGGQLMSDSDTNGSDVDAALHYGLGVKLALTTCNDARVEVRNTVADARDGQDTPNYPELLFGLSWIFGGTPTPPPAPPDSDEDGIADVDDACPSEVGVAPEGCPAPPPPPAAAPQPEAAPGATAAPSETAPSGEDTPPVGGTAPAGDARPAPEGSPADAPPATAPAPTAPPAAATPPAGAPAAPGAQ